MDGEGITRVDVGRGDVAVGVWGEGVWTVGEVFGGEGGNAQEALRQ